MTRHLSRGAALTGSLGTFTAPAGKQPTSTTVYWGDQFSDSSPASVIPQGNGVYQVTGAHTYSSPGTYGITIVADFGRLPSGQEDVAVVYSSADVT